MRAGRLRQRVTLVSVADVRAADGTVSQSETDLDTVWAEIAPIRGQEFFAAQTVQSNVSVKITIRYYTGLSTKHRIRFGTRMYDIRDVINWQERNVFIELMCTERV